MSVTLVPIQHIPDFRERGERSKRFVGRIVDLRGQESIVGMSGGPIFGLYRKDSSYYYEVVAIQSSWDRGKNGTIYGCALDEVAAEIARRLPNVNRSDRKSVE